MDITIEKMKIKESLTLIEYSTHVFTEDGDMITSRFTLKSEAKPHKTFFDAFQGLKEHAINICELSLFKDDQSVKKNHVVTGVTIKEHMDDSRVIISLLKYTKSGKCFSLNTPLVNLATEDYEKLDELAAELEILKAEAVEFIRGKNGNQQIALDFASVKQQEAA